MQNYHMTDILPLLSIPQPPYGKVSYNIACPICEQGRPDKDGHMNINLKKDVFRCPKCGQFHGGVFDLYAYYENIPRDDVLEAVEARLGGKHYSPKGQKTSIRPKALPAPPDVPQAALADIDTRDRVYRALLEKLSLASDHLENLYGRGLSDEAIARFQYRTTPVVGFQAIAHALMKEGHNLFGVPGFYREEDGRWTMAIYRRGIMIPCRDRLGRIQRLHTRLDNVRRNKFRPFSSTDKRDGCTAENWCHLAGPVRDSILLIEGYMKADIVHHLTGQTVLAIPGVTSLHHLETTLKELVGLGVKHVMTCFDMDYLKNWHVSDAYGNLLELLGSLDITFGTYLWWPDYNGLDDYVWQFCLGAQST